jgi:hypothetical protein
MEPLIDSFPVPGESKGRLHALAEKQLPQALAIGAIGPQDFLVEEVREPLEVK